VPASQRNNVLSFFEARFGIPASTFARYALLERRKTYVLLPHSEHIRRLASFQVHQVGLPLLRKIRQHLKPTTAGLQHFGHLATRHIVDLSPELCHALLYYRMLTWEASYQPGYVILRSEGHILGCGLYTPGLLRSQIPRRYVQHQRLEPRDSLPGI
jgi:NOL1/NOP2/fmu family ribosome biogenesis protein